VATKLHCVVHFLSEFFCKEKMSDNMFIIKTIADKC
jgi:hypothetical protein